MYDAIIVGAGLSGLTAAIQLQQHNKNVILLEASDRIGGRILTKQTSAGFPIDLGAQWFGPKDVHPRMHTLLDQFQLTKVKTYKKGHVLYHLEDDMKKVPHWLLPLSLKSFPHLLSLYRKIDKVTDQIQKNGKFKSNISATLDKLSIQDWLNANVKDLDVKKYYMMLAREMNCVEPKDVSSLDTFWTICAAGGLSNIKKAEAYWVKEGVHALVDKMADRVKEKIHLCSPVQKIQQTNDDVSVYFRNKQLRAKRIIITAPIRTINQIQFSPSIPKQMQKLLQYVTPSSVLKSQLVFKKPFWRTHGINGLTYSEDGLHTLDSSPEDASYGILTFIAVGNQAKMLSELSDSAQKETIIQAVERLLKIHLDNVEEFYLYDWIKDMWIQGGYGFHFPPNVLSENGASLFEPFGRIHWAGTETAMKWRMYMEGAIESGERAATELLKHVK